MTINVPCTNTNCEGCPFRLNDAGICIIDYAYNSALDDIIEIVLNERSLDDTIEVIHLQYLLEKARAYPCKINL